MGTVYSVKVVGSQRSALEIRTEIDRLLARIALSMSGYRDDSELARFNSYAGTDWFAVSIEFGTVVAGALEVAAKSDGALDITVAPLVNLWGFGREGEPAVLPDAQAIQAAREKIGYRKLELREDHRAVRKTSADLTLDLNAVAAGYAADLLAERFNALGLHNYMIDMGGEIRTQGTNASGEPWRIAVERPVDTDTSQPFVILEMRNRSLTTSGEYRHKYVRNGRQYSHTIDPRTGEPVQHALASVVVIADTALQADAWTTALNVLGEKEGLALAQRLKLAAMFIVAEQGNLAAYKTQQWRAETEQLRVTRKAFWPVASGQ
jgi:thiamine biosynthesis lipoprotein